MPAVLKAVETGKHPAASDVPRQSLRALTPQQRGPPPRISWKTVAGELARRVRSLPPRPRRRRRSDDTGQAFKAAKTIMRRAAVLPIGVFEAAAVFLADTLDWLNLWQHNDLAGDEGLHHTEPNHLSPHL